MKPYIKGKHWMLTTIQLLPDSNHIVRKISKVNICVHHKFLYHCEALKTPETLKKEMLLITREINFLSFKCNELDRK